MTPRAYSRDELAAPLRKLAAVYSDIRCGVFLPDRTRSGMIQAGAKGDEGGEEEPAEDDAAALAVPARGAGVDDDDPDDDDDDDEGSTTESDSTDTDSDSNLPLADFVVTAGGVVKHVPGDAGKTACGKPLGTSFRPCRSEVPVCRLCTAAALKNAGNEGPSSKRTRVT